MTEGGAATFCMPQVESRLALPQSVREAIGLRLHPLPSPCQHLLQLASVMGRTFDVETLARVTDTAHAQLVHALDRAVAAQIITPIPAAAGQYRFAHMLFRDTLYADLPTEQRLRWRRQVAKPGGTVGLPGHPGVWATARGHVYDRHRIHTRRPFLALFRGYGQQQRGCQSAALCGPGRSARHGDAGPRRGHPALPAGAPEPDLYTAWRRGPAVRTSAGARQRSDEGW